MKKSQSGGTLENEDISMSACSYWLGCFVFQATEQFWFVFYIKDEIFNECRERESVSVSVRERERSACNTECSLFNDFALFVLSVLGPKSKQAVPPVTIAMHTAAVAFSPTYK